MASPTHRSPRVGIASSYATTQRVQRRPSHKFLVRYAPYQIQPIMIAPVLPGETMKTLMLQSQTWSSPMQGQTMRSIGWWHEYNFFYVKHRDLLGYETDAEAPALGKDLIDMFVSNSDLSAHEVSVANQNTYAGVGSIDYVQECLKRIVEEYFRDEGEAWDVATINGLPMTKIYGKGSSDPFEKLTLDDEYEDRRVSLDADGDGDITVDEVNRAYVEWAAMKDAGLMDMDYEDWMRTYGVTATVPNVDRVDHHVPEDIAHFREFSYPTNTVEPTDGRPSTSVGWRVATRTSKAHLFKEPGWIVGVCYARPKIYLGNQRGNIAGYMKSRADWLPAIMNDELDVSHQNWAFNEGPLANVVDEEAGGYWIDIRDLLNHGDQFINVTASGAPFISLPAANGNRRYADPAEVMAPFITGESYWWQGFETDGVISLGILGRQQERYKNLVLGKA